MQPGGANALIFFDAQRRRVREPGLRQLLVHRSPRVVHWPTDRPGEVFSYDSHIPPTQPLDSWHVYTLFHSAESPRYAVFYTPPNCRKATAGFLFKDMIPTH